MNNIIFVPIRDYYRTRKQLWKKFLIPGVIGVLALLGAFVVDYGNSQLVSDVFSDFVGIQINVVAILIAFSVAIITILVSADNDNINKLRESLADEVKYNTLSGKRLSLFQILLSNIAYNVIVEILYLIVLIGISLIKCILPIAALKYIVSVCIFFILHILFVLLESVAQMYLTFWSRK